MIKTKKKFLLLAVITVVAMLCCGMLICITPTTHTNPKSTNMVVKADTGPFNDYSWPSSDATVTDNGITYRYVITDAENHEVALCKNTEYSGDSWYASNTYMSSSDAGEMNEDSDEWTPKQITIPSSVTISDTNYAVTGLFESGFSMMVNVTSISVPNSVVAIGNGCFMDSTRLTEITWGNNMNVSYLGDRAFYGCTSLTSLVIPNGVVEFLDSTLYGCNNLGSLTFPDTLRYGMFGDYPGYPYYGEFSDSVTEANKSLYYTDDNTGAIYLKSGSNNYFALIYLPNGENISAAITENTKIVDSVWSSVETDLESITIPSGVRSICGSFCSLDSLESVTFANGSNLDYVKSSFINCTGLSTLTIPASVKTIEGYLEPSLSFQGCGFSSISVESGNTVYDSRNNCNAIIETATNKLLIGSNNATIPATVVKIQKSAFENCVGLTSINIPASVSTIGDYAFKKTGLTSITVEAGNTVYDSRNNCNAIIETATNKLIVGCKNTVIPNDVTKIGSYAFCYCEGLESITIPASVTSIEGYAFQNCADLTSVIFEGTTAPTLTTQLWGAKSQYSFSNNNANLKFYVPNGAVSEYQGATGWSSIQQADIIEQPLPPAPPETGVIIDIILPSVVIGLTLVATVVVWKKKEQY